MDLPNWAVAGVSFDEKYGNEFDTLWHIRGIVDGMAVCRCWRPTKRRWHYEVLSGVWFDVTRDRLHPRATAQPDASVME